MGFEIVAPSVRPIGIDKGHASISLPGKIGFNYADIIEMRLNVAKISLLVDASTRRLAIRKARDGEPEVRTTCNKSKTVLWISCCAAARQLGVDLKSIKGRYRVDRQDDLLIVQLRGEEAKRA